MIESKGEVYHVYCERECVMNNLSKEKFESVWEFCKELQTLGFLMRDVINQNTRRGELLTMSMKNIWVTVWVRSEFRQFITSSSKLVIQFSRQFLELVIRVTRSITQVLRFTDYELRSHNGRLHHYSECSSLL